MKCRSPVVAREREAISMLPCSCLSSCRNRINVTAKAGMSSMLAGTTVSVAERRLSHWQHQLLFHVFPVRMSHTTEGDGREEPQQATSVTQRIISSRPPGLSLLFTRDMPAPPSLGPLAHKNEHLNLPLTRLTHSFMHSLFTEPYCYGWIASPTKLICWSSDCPGPQSMTVFGDRVFKEVNNV